MAASIRQLGISPKPLMSMYYTERSGILPSGKIIESGVDSFEGYIGEAREAVHETF